MAFRASLRRLASKMTSAEREAALRDANEKMKHYHVNRPHIHKVIKKRRLFEGEDGNQNFIQAMAASAFLTAFLITPFLGRKVSPRIERFTFDDSTVFAY